MVLFFTYYNQLIHARCPVVKCCCVAFISSVCQLKEEQEKLTLLQGPETADPTNDPSFNEEIPVQETSFDPPEDPKSFQTEREERSRSSADESAHKNRSKRESRRMRELEQAQFSLELLKVRTTSLGGAVQEDQHRLSPPRGSPASHGSFELLSVDDMDTDTAVPPEDQPAMGSENPNHDDMEGPRATFYIPSDQSPAHKPKERRESASRRPVVVLISMQKESPVEDAELLAAQVHQAGVAPCESHTISIAGLEVAAASEPARTGAKEATSGTSLDQGARSCASEADVQKVKASRPAQEAPSPVLDTKPPKAQKKSSAQTVIVNMVEKPSSTVFSPPRRKLPFSK